MHRHIPKCLHVPQMIGSRINNSTGSQHNGNRINHQLGTIEVDYGHTEAGHPIVFALDGVRFFCNKM